MSYPIARFDFETGGTLASEGLTDIDSVFGIETTHAYTGTHGVSASGTGNHDLITTAADTLSGNLTVTGYFYPTAANGFTLYSNMQPFGTAGNTFVQVSFGPGGLTVAQEISGTATSLNSAGSGVSIPTGVWLGMELRVNGTAVSVRLWNTSTGNFFHHVPGGAGSWVSSVQQVSETLSGFPAGGGSFGPRIAAGNTIYFDDLIEDAPAPVISTSAFSIATSAGTYQLTAGGFTDPLLTNPGGVTWSSGTPSIATVGATTGLVTAVANGSATITATGIRDSSQTATSTATITNQATLAPTTATLSGPPIGPVGAASTNFTITLDHAAQSGGVSCPITSSVGGDTITSTPVVIASSQITGTFTVTASTSGSRNITLGITTPSLTIDSSPLSYTAYTVVAAVKIDCTTATTTPQVSLTNEVVFVPLASHTFNFAALASNGQNLAVLGIDGATPITASLRSWNTGVGLRLIERLKCPSVDGFSNPIYVGIDVAVGNLGLANPPHTVWNCGSDLSGWGITTAYDRFANVLWSFPWTQEHGVTGLAIADVNGDGTNEVVIGYDFPGASATGGVICLSNTGSLIWNWVNPSSSGKNTYIRTVAVAKLRSDYLHLQTVAGGALGHVALIDYQGNTIWVDTTDYLGNLPDDETVQNIIVDDLISSGTLYIFFVVGSQLFKVSAANAIIWTYTDPAIGDNIHYNLASGHITSTTTKQIVMTSANLTSTTNIGAVTVVDDTGTLVWTKFYPFPLFSVSVGDVNSDGYDEILLTAGSADNYGMPLGWGAVIVLDKNGNELTAGSIASSSKCSTYADYNGDGTKELSVSCDSGVLYRYAFDSVGGSVKTTVPSLAANALDTVSIAASSSSSNVPPQGDFWFNATGSNGSSPPNMNQRIGTWTVQSGTIQSPSDGDTGNNNAIEATGVTTDGLEIESTQVQVSQGTGGSIYYYGFWYRCSNWSGSPPYPNGYRAWLSNTGNVYLGRYASGSSTATTIYGSAATGPTFNTTDSIRARIVASGNDHALSYQKNGGPWITAYRVQDTTGSPITSAGTVGLFTNRGQTQFSNIVLQAIPSAYGGANLNGPAPDIVPAFLTPTTATLSGPTSGTNGTASSPFTVTLDQPPSVAESFPITYSGGSIATSPVIVPIGWMSDTFTVTPSSTGTANVVLGAGTTGLTPAGTPISYNATSGGAIAYPAAMMMGL
jgi:hypothetical protein